MQNNYSHLGMLAPLPPLDMQWGMKTEPSPYFPTGGFVDRANPAVNQHRGTKKMATGGPVNGGTDPKKKGKKVRYVAHVRTPDPDLLMYSIASGSLIHPEIDPDKIPREIVDYAEKFANASTEDQPEMIKGFQSLLKKHNLKPQQFADTSFRKEFNRAKEFFEDAYPGGVEYVEVDDGEESVRKALKDLDPEEEIFFSMHNQGSNSMFNVPIENMARIMNESGATRNTVCRSGACWGDQQAGAFEKTREDDDPTNDFKGRWVGTKDRKFLGVNMKAYKDFKKANPDAPIDEETLNHIMYSTRYNPDNPYEFAMYDKLTDDLMSKVQAMAPEVKPLTAVAPKPMTEPKPLEEITPPQLAHGGFAPKRKPCNCKPKFFLGGLLSGLSGGGQQKGFFNMQSNMNQNISGAAGGIGAIGGLAGGLLGGTKFGQTGVGSALSGVLSGAGAGAKLGLPGMIGGALIGGVTSLINRKKEKEAEEARKLEEQAQKETAMTMSRLGSDQSRLGTFPTEGVEAASYFAADGGFIMPEYEAEGGEVLEDPQQDARAFSGVLEGLSSDMQKLNGLPHSQGGMDMTGGEFIYTKRWKGSNELVNDLYNTTGIKFKKDTYAGLAETIGRKKGQIEQKLDSYDPASLNTANMMLERLEEGLELVKAEQEYRKMA